MSSIVCARRPASTIAARRTLLICASLVAFALGGCDSDHDEPHGGALLGIDDGASAGQSASVVVTADKATTLKLKSGAELVIEPGSVEKDVQVSIERPKDSEAVEFVQTLDEKDKPASAPYVLTPHGTMFKKEVMLSVPIAKGADKQNLTFAYLSDQKDKVWKPAGTAQVDNEKATVALKHFSVLILVERSAPSADASTQVPDMRMDAGPAFPDAGVSKGDSGVSSTPDAGCVSTFACTTVAASCGVVSDNCGAPHTIELECSRGCGVAEICTANVCGPPPCVPATCLSALGESGCHPMLADGCGGTLNCSACSDWRGFPQTCTDFDTGPAESWSCATPCSTRTDCPPDYNECTGPNDLGIFSLDCQPEGFCSISGVVTECPCQDNACLP